MVESGGLLSGLRFCRDCKNQFKIQLSRDVGVAIYWVEDMVLFDVVLLLSVGERVLYPFVLHREVYGFK